MSVDQLGPIDYAKLAEKVGKELDTAFKPVSKGSVFNTSVTAGTNIFASDLEPTDTPTIFRIYACFDTAGVLTVRRTSGGTTVSEQLNSGNNLTANASYMFDIIVDSGETINLQYSVNATCLKLSIVEISSGA